MQANHRVQRRDEPAQDRPVWVLKLNIAEEGTSQDSMVWVAVDSGVTGTEPEVRKWPVIHREQWTGRNDTCGPEVGFHRMKWAVQERAHPKQRGLAIRLRHAGEGGLMVTMRGGQSATTGPLGPGEFHPVSDRAPQTDREQNLAGTSAVSKSASFTHQSLSGISH